MLAFREHGIVVIYASNAVPITNQLDLQGIGRVMKSYIFQRSLIAILSTGDCLISEITPSYRLSGTRRAKVSEGAHFVDAVFVGTHRLLIDANGGLHCDRDEARTIDNDANVDDESVAMKEILARLQELRVVTSALNEHSTFLDEQLRSLSLASALFYAIQNDRIGISLAPCRESLLTKSSVGVAMRTVIEWPADDLGRSAASKAHSDSYAEWSCSVCLVIGWCSSY